MKCSVPVAIHAVNHVLLQLVPKPVQGSVREAASVLVDMPGIQQETVYPSTNVQVCL